MKTLLPTTVALLLAVPVPANAGHGQSRRVAKLERQSTAPNLQPPGTEKSPTSDPLEKVNRATFTANDALYKGVMQPISKGTEAVLPNPALRSLQNFGQNIETPVRLVNRLVRAEPMQAGKEFTKLVINSTIGLGGLFKPSESFAALRDVKPADTGQTLGKAGVPPGPYLVLPVLGPSNCRDLVGKAGDWALNPLVYMGKADIPTEVRSSIGAAKGIDENRHRMKAYRATVEMTVDPYVAVREAYTDHRKASVNGS